MRLLAITGLIALAITACGDAGTTETTEPDTTTTTEDAETTSTLEPPPRAPEVDLSELPDWFQKEDVAPEGLVAVIGEELDAEYLGSMAVQWPTGGLGCGSGENELQVVTPGFVIFYDDSGSLVRVHASEIGQWKECDLSRPLEGTPVLTS